MRRSCEGPRAGRAGLCILIRMFKEAVLISQDFGGLAQQKEIFIHLNVICIDCFLPIMGADVRLSAVFKDPSMVQR